MSLSSPTPAEIEEWISRTRSAGENPSDALVRMFPEESGGSPEIAAGLVFHLEKAATAYLARQSAAGQDGFQASYGKLFDHEDPDRRDFLQLIGAHMQRLGIDGSPSSIQLLKLLAQAKGLIAEHHVVTTNKTPGDADRSRIIRQIGQTLERLERLDPELRGTLLRAIGEGSPGKVLEHVPAQNTGSPGSAA